MKQKCIIRVINEKQSGVSRVTGNPWTRQKINVSWTEPIGNEGRTIEQLLIVTLLPEDIAIFEQHGYQVGDEIEGNILFYPRQSGKYFDNDVTMRLSR